MSDLWFYSWASYTSCDAGGQTIYKAGSNIGEFAVDTSPVDVLMELQEALCKMHGVSEVHITALNRV